MGGCCAFDNPVVNFFRDLFCSDGGCGYTPPSVQTEQHAKKVANELAQEKERYNNLASAVEREIMDDITSSMNSLIDYLKKNNKKKYGDKELNLDIGYIKKKNEELCKQVVGHVGSVIQERFVLTDPQLSIILKENDDRKRTENFHRFCDDVFEEAIKSLKKPITDSIHAQQQVIELEINQRVGEVSSSAEKTLELLSSIQEQKEKGDSDCEEVKISCMYRVGVLDCILDELEK